MIVHNVTQSSPEWFALRSGIPTASEFSNILTPKKLEPAKCDAYLWQKLAERWMGRPIEGGGSWAMEQGKMLEEEAYGFLEMELNCTIHHIGFITTDDKRFGCSPDGGIGDPVNIAEGAEIKCPQPNTHVAYLSSGTLPEAYKLQVQGSMLVTGCSRWHFLSWCRGFPPLLLPIERDEMVIGKLAAALDAFDKRLNEEYAKLVELNGGEPNRALFTAPITRSMEFEGEGLEEILGGTQ